MEAGGYGPTRGVCFVARRLEMTAAVGLLWNSWCVFSAERFHEGFVSILLSSNADSLLQV